MNKKTWIIFGILAVAAVGGLIYTGSKNQLNVDDVKREQIVMASERNGNVEDHVLGSKDAKVLIFEYADYQCPACAEASNLMSKVVEKYEGKVALIYRHFPLPGHNNAKAAAAAAGFVTRRGSANNESMSKETASGAKTTEYRRALQTTYVTTLVGYYKGGDVTSPTHANMLSALRTLSSRLKVARAADQATRDHYAALTDIIKRALTVK